MADAPDDLVIELGDTFTFWSKQYGELKGQGLRIASKSLWDPNFDNWTSYTFTNETIHCTGIVFGNYFE